MLSDINGDFMMWFSKALHEDTTFFLLTAQGILGTSNPYAEQMLVYTIEVTLLCLSLYTLPACSLHSAIVCWMVSGAPLEILMSDASSVCWNYISWFFSMLFPYLYLFSTAWGTPVVTHLGGPYSWCIHGCSPQAFKDLDPDSSLDT